MDAKTRVWSEWTFELLRYDEAQGVPSIERGIEPEIDLDVKSPQHSVLEEPALRAPR